MLVSHVRAALVEKGLFKQSGPASRAKIRWKGSLDFGGVFGEAACTQKEDYIAGKAPL